MKIIIWVIIVCLPAITGCSSDDSAKIRKEIDRADVVLYCTPEEVDGSVQFRVVEIWRGEDVASNILDGAYLALEKRTKDPSIRFGDMQIVAYKLSEETGPDGRRYPVGGGMTSFYRDASPGSHSINEIPSFREYTN